MIDLWITSNVSTSELIIHQFKYIQFVSRVPKCNLCFYPICHLNKTNLKFSFIIFSQKSFKNKIHSLRTDGLLRLSRCQKTFKIITVPTSLLYLPSLKDISNIKVSTDIEMNILSTTIILNTLDVPRFYISCCLSSRRY